MEGEKINWFLPKLTGFHIGRLQTGESKPSVQKLENTTLT
jgi:hypothetical protein